MNYFMYALPLWVIFVALVAMSQLVVELGYRLARRLNRKKGEEAEGDISGTVAALFGLLAFILAFSFSITTNRLDTRKQWVLDEANAITTCYLRAGLILQPQGAAIRNLLEEYLDIRLKSSATNSKIAETVARSEEIHGLLWSQVESLAKENLNSETVAGSLTEVINVHQKRKTVLFIYRIPPFAWLSLLLLMMASMFGTGYQIGASGKRRSFAILLMAAAFALVIIMIAAMDRPGEGLFPVSQQPLMDVLEMMRKTH